MVEFVLATNNAHKVLEMRAILENGRRKVLSMKEAGFHTDPEENGTTFEENALIKARAACAASGRPALADDSGICVDALNGEPGVYSARYGFDDTLDDWGRLLLLLKNTEHVPDGQRQAKFVCVISFITPDGKIIQARGEIHGELTRQPRGENGFGYDPIFYYPPFGKTTAELPAEQKNAVSHRGNALRIFYEKLKEEGYADK